MSTPERLAALQDLPDEWLYCRGYGHQWEVTLSAGAVVPRHLIDLLAEGMPPDAAKAVRSTSKVVHRGWRTQLKSCRRSGCVVLYLWDRGDLVFERRTWPDGYLLPAGLEEHEHYIVEAQQELWRRALLNGGRAA